MTAALIVSSNPSVAHDSIQYPCAHIRLKNRLGGRGDKKWLCCREMRLSVPIDRVARESVHAIACDWC